jgi:hypothetical protein
MKKSEKLRGSELIALLPENIQQKYVDNMIALQDSGDSEDILEIRDGKFINLADMLAQSFAWDKSSEGREYWEEVLNAKYDGKNLDAGIDEILFNRKDEVTSILEKALDKLASIMLGNDEESVDAMRAEEILSGKTGKEYFKFLTPKEQEEYRQNAEKFTTEDMIKANMSRKHRTFNSFLRGSFPFIITPQGHSYWAGICEREIAEDLTEVLSELKINTTNGEV